jgi:putative nucleotide-binding sugar-metabolising enzyme
VAITSRQLDRALDLEGVRGVELSVPRLLEEGERERELERVVSEMNRALAEAEVVVYTSREVVGAPRAGRARRSGARSLMRS